MNKKIGCFILSFIIFLSLFSTLIASNNNDLVGQLTIFSDPKGSHAFVTIKNISKNNIIIGLLKGIEPNKTISIGTWQDGTLGSSASSADKKKSPHVGIYYNLESYKVTVLKEMPKRVSLTIPISSSELTKINDYIKTHDSWSPLTNCSSFSVGLWNTILSNSLNAGLINNPGDLAKAIKNHKFFKYETGKSVPFDYDIYYAKGSNAPILYALRKNLM